MVGSAVLGAGFAYPVGGRLSFGADALFVLGLEAGRDHRGYRGFVLMTGVGFQLASRAVADGGE